MPNRRDFIKTVAGATTGALVMSSALAEARAQGRGGAGGGRGEASGAPTGPVTRRIVQVGGKRVRVVDVHAHATVAEVAQVVAGTEYAVRNGGGRPMADERIWEMDKRGIDTQVLSINGYWWYGVKDRDLADKIVRTADQGLA